MQLDSGIVRRRLTSLGLPAIPFLFIVAGCWQLERSAAAGNFICSDAAIAQAAEYARIRSANFWSGTALPGDWSSPCPIQVSPANHSGCGRTQFHIERGEVFGWRMEIAGTRSALLQDVIPHEVDHMVRASLVRRAVERWLDEGCAVLMESPEIHQQLRITAAGADPSMIDLDWLEGEHYPRGAEQLQQFYAIGFSLVEYLLTRGTPANLLEFQRDSSAMTTRLDRHYKLTVDALRAGWVNWMRSGCKMNCSDGTCSQHPVPANSPSPASTSAKPLLTIWTADWCVPCQKFKADFSTNPEFRNCVEAAFEVQQRDFDRNAAEAASFGVKTLPTFVLPQGMLTGYLNSQDLLQRLGLLLPPATPPTEQTDSNPLPSSTAPSTTSPAEGSAATLPAPAQTQSSASGWRILQWVPVTLSALQWAGIIGGSVATGGVGGAAMAAVLFLLKRKLNHGHPSSTVSPAAATNSAEGSAAAVTAPFPRQLDEASELLELRQTEGRVATLDTLRGMFLDDELEKLEQSTDTVTTQFALNLRKAIDTRVDEIAPLTTEVTV